MKTLKEFLAEELVKFDAVKAAETASQLKIDFSAEDFEIEDFLKGMNVEAEHGKDDPQTNVTNDDPVLTGKIALAHLKEDPKYYDKLQKMEKGDTTKPSVVKVPR